MTTQQTSEVEQRWNECWQGMLNSQIGMDGIDRRSAVAAFNFQQSKIDLLQKEVEELEYVKVGFENYIRDQVAFAYKLQCDLTAAKSRIEELERKLGYRRGEV